MSANGYNPLRWDCAARGCFNAKKRPKIELFAECFPGRINFGDVDGVVEMHGHALFLEWKEGPQSFGVGQRLTWERLTRAGTQTVVCVAGDAEAMVVTHMAFFHGGRFFPWRPATLAAVKDAMRRWVRKVRDESLRAIPLNRPDAP